MPKCILCGRSGDAFAVNDNGLCRTCDDLVLGDAQQRGRIINSCISIIEKSENLSLRLSRCELAIEHAKALLRYQEKGIPTTIPLPSDYISKINYLRDDIIVSSMEKLVDRTLDKARLASTLVAAISQANSAIAEIEKMKGLVSDPALLIEHETRIKDFTQYIQQKAFMEANKEPFSSFKRKKR